MIHEEYRSASHECRSQGRSREYRRRGWSPIPIKERSKEPNLRELRPYLTRKATQEELGAWSWSGVGIVTGPVSGVLVLDVDGPEGEAELQKHGHPATPMVRTASGGLHLYFKHPEQHVRTGIRVAPGLDVKASGGYVVAPPVRGAERPSLTSGSSRHRRRNSQTPQVADGSLRAGTAERSGRIRSGNAYRPGKRNNVLASLAGTMRRRGMGEGEILAALQVANEQRCQPPLEAEEVEKIAASVARYEPADNVVQHLGQWPRELSAAPGRTTLRTSGTPSGSSRTTVKTSATATPGASGWYGPGRSGSATRPGGYTGSPRRLFGESTGRPPMPKTRTDARPWQSTPLASEAETKIRAMLELAKVRGPCLSRRARLRSVAPERPERDGRPAHRGTARTPPRGPDYEVAGSITTRLPPHRHGLPRSSARSRLRSSGGSLRSSPAMPSAAMSRSTS